MKRYGKSLTLLLVLCFVLCPLAAQGNAEAGTEDISVKNSGISQTLAKLNTLYQYLNVNALYDLDDTQLEDNLTTALIAALDDPYAEYFSADDSDAVNESLSGTFVGIGIYFSKYNPMFIDWEDETTYMLNVSSPFPGGPAERAGVRAHDLISHINGESVAQMTADEASDLLRGEEGVPLTITVHRGESVFDLTVTPEKVTTPEVSSAIIEGTDYAYMMIPDFTSATYSLASQELTKLTEQGMKALIIDLRNNPGGVVDSACMIANFFLDNDDVIVTTKYKESSGRPSTRLVANDQTRKYHIPVVLIVNGGSASASEILAAALQDNSAAVVIGQQTFGKGIIQDIIRWNDGYVKYTSAQYLTPNGDDIHEVGITPDIIVEEPELTDEQVEEYFTFLSEHSGEMTAWIEEHPDYSQENIEAFAQRYQQDCSFDPLYLKIAIRNEYIAAMDWEDRPAADPVNDIYLKAAISYLDSL